MKSNLKSSEKYIYKSKTIKRNWTISDNTLSGFV